MTKKVTETKTVTQKPPAEGARDDSARDDSGGGSVHYSSCAKARAAGAAPLYKGDPGYGRHLDRDGDGDACES